nr:MAG TPA: hypothetical protein [Crassvirales sp.]
MRLNKAHILIFFPLIPCLSSQIFIPFLYKTKINISAKCN